MPPKQNLAECAQLFSVLSDFSGKNDENFDFFLTQFNDTAELISLNEETKIIFLKSKLRGNALQYLINHQELQKSTYEELCKALKKKFQKKLNFSQTQDLYLNCKQGPNQSVQEFAESLELAANNFLACSELQHETGARQFNDKIKLSKFIDGLSQDIKIETKKLGPSTLENAIKIAIRIENALKEAANNTPTEQNYEIFNLMLKQKAEQEKEIEELKKQINQLKTNNTSSNNTRPFCTICHRFNHSSDICWFNPENINTQHAHRTPRYPTRNDRNRQNFNAPNHNAYAPHTNYNYNYNSGQNQNTNYQNTNRKPNQHRPNRRNYDRDNHSYPENLN